MHTTEAIVTRPDVGQHVELFGSDLRDAVESLLIGELRAALLMDDDDTDELPLDASFFDLGLTSLRLMEIKQRVDAVLGVEISTTALFNFPTVVRLVDYLMDNVLPGLTLVPETLVSLASSTRNQET